MDNKVVDNDNLHCRKICYRCLVFCLVLVLACLSISGCGQSSSTGLTSEQTRTLEFFTEGQEGLLDRINKIYSCSDYTFVFFSDLHNGWRNLIKMLDTANTLRVNAVINAGDTVLKYINDSETDFSWYTSMIGESKVDVLTAVGNHDVWENGYWIKAEPNLTYREIIKPVIKNVDWIIQPDGAEENGLCYYYKDYGHIRVIVLNAMAGDPSVAFWDDNEANWLKAVLSESLKEKKHVICVNHAPFNKEISIRNQDYNWNSIEDYRLLVDYDNICTENEALSIVQEYINNGGVFICWLCGHTHVDEVLQASGYPGQLMLGIASARYSFHSDGLVSEDKNDPSFYCFDYLGINEEDGMLYRTRFGWNIDSSLKVRDFFAYDYINDIIFDSNKRIE
ncbi:MAG: metallophosphoesterase [Firmicutes bacterium]|nr:metallophosphoesterase [Bacillota bacterium]